MSLRAHFAKQSPIQHSRFIDELEIASTERFAHRLAMTY
jgi:hypothetical protein